jgi:hypothetical protein
MTSSHPAPRPPAHHGADEGDPVPDVESDLPGTTDGGARPVDNPSG